MKNSNDPFYIECQEVFVAAVFTLHAGKTVLQIAASN